MQRAIFQPVMLGAIIVTAISVSVTGVVTAEIIKLYLLGLPALLAGLWLGFKLYGRVDDAMFRKVEPTASLVLLATRLAALLYCWR